MSKNNRYIDWKNWDKDSFAKTSKLEEAYFNNIVKLLKLKKSSKILEIGTYTGYSAICLARGLKKDGVLHTIDINEELEYFAREYFEKANLSKQIISHVGNAMDILPKLNISWDLVFIDADKENYINYFNLVIDKLNNNGVILADNVLWSGKVINSEDHDLTTNVLREFNKSVNNDNRVETILLPIRDGISIIRINPSI